MIVVVSGMQRSGSTFSYNVVRELLEVRGGVSVYSSNSMNDLSAGPSEIENAIFKSHFPDEMINAFLVKRAIPCVCTVRKPEDAIASWMSVFGFSLEESVSMYAAWLSWHKKMHRYMLNIHYDEIDDYPWLVIWKISRYLLNGWSCAEIYKIWNNNRKAKVYENSKALNIAESVDIGFSFYDKVKFYHRHHVSSIKSRRATELLSKEQLSFIRTSLHQYINKDGEYQWG